MIVFINDTINGSISLIANSPLRQVIQYISYNIIPINISSITMLGWLYVKYVRTAKLSVINIDKRIIMCYSKFVIKLMEKIINKLRFSKERNLQLWKF